MLYRRFAIRDECAPHLRVSGFRTSDEVRVFDALDLLREVARPVFEHLLREVRVVKRSVDCGLDTGACAAVAVSERVVYVGQHPDAMATSELALALGRESLHYAIGLGGELEFTPHACRVCAPDLEASTSERWAEAMRREIAAATSARR